MTGRRKREIGFLERLRAACRRASKELRSWPPQLDELGLHIRSPEWPALFGALVDAGYYGAPSGQWVRRVNMAIRALKQPPPKTKGRAR